MAHYNQAAAKRFMLLCTVTAFFLLTGIANAAAPTAIDDGICAIINLLTSKTGKGIATLAIIFVAIGAFFGKVNTGLALMLLSGIVGVFGAASLTNFIGNSTNSNVTSGSNC